MDKLERKDLEEQLAEVGVRYSSRPPLPPPSEQKAKKAWNNKGVRTTTERPSTTNTEKQETNMSNGQQETVETKSSRSSVHSSSHEDPAVRGILEMNDGIKDLRSWKTRAQNGAIAASLTLAGAGAVYGAVKLFTWAFGGKPSATVPMS